MKDKALQVATAVACLIALAGCSTAAKPAPAPVPQPPVAGSPAGQTPTSGKATVTRLPVGGGPLSAAAVNGEKNVWVARDKAVLASSDAGATWAKVGEVKDRINQLDFVSPRQGWAVTEAGLLTTADGGKTWTAVQTSGFTSQRVDFISATQGWAADSEGKLFGTTDGGAKWSALPTPCTSGWRMALSFIDTTKGFAMCGGEPGAGQQPKRLFSTTDGGQHWTQTADSAKGAGLSGSGTVSDLQFTDASHGFLATSRYDVLTTADGGKTWKGMGTDPETLAVSQVMFKDGKQGYALSRSGLLATSDSGRSWQSVYPALAPADLTRVVTPAPDAWYGFGSPGSLGAVLKSADRGATWSKVGQVNGGEEVIGISFPDAAHGWALTARPGFNGTSVRTLWQTTDSGASWTKLTQGPVELKALFTTLSFVDGQTGFIATGWGHLSVTRDGGKTLTPVDATDSRSTDYQFISPANGWKLDDFVLKATADGGKTWSPVGFAERTGSFFRMAGGKAWAVYGVKQGTGYENALASTTDDGKTWTRWDLGGLHPAYVQFADAQTGLLVSVDQELFVTRDGGQSWTQVR